MGRFIIWITSCCCIALLFSGCFMKSSVGDVESAPRLQDEDPRIAELNRALEASRSEAAKCRENRDRLENEIKRTGAEVQIKKSQIESMNRTIEKQAAVISLQNTIIRLFDDSQQTLQNSLQEQIEAEDLEVGDSDQSIKYVVPNKLLFQPDGVGLSREGKARLRKLADVMLKEPYPYIRVLGHTDDRPLKSSARFADNWELSTARATAVVRFFHEVLGIAPERLSAVGCGQFTPIADNGTAEGRSMNRRIEIILETGIPSATTVEIPDL